MARRLDHRRDLSQQELHHLREEQGETTSVDTPEGDEGSRGRRESTVLSHRRIEQTVIYYGRFR